MLDSTVVCRRALGCEWGEEPTRARVCSRVVRCSGKTRRTGAPKHRQRFLSVRPGGWSRTPVNSSGTRLTLTLDGGPMGHSAR